jgi:hypothetical protein
VKTNFNNRCPRCPQAVFCDETCLQRSELWHGANGVCEKKGFQDLDPDMKLCLHLMMVIMMDQTHATATTPELVSNLSKHLSSYLVDFTLKAALVVTSLRESLSLQTTHIRKLVEAQCQARSVESSFITIFKKK